MTNIRNLKQGHSRAAQVIGIALVSAALAFLTTNTPSVLHVIWMIIIPLVIGAALNRKDGCLMIVLLPSVSVSVVLLVRSVFPFEPPAKPLAREDGLAYQTVITLWDNAELRFRPFELSIRRNRDPTSFSHILFAEQCEDVSVIQTTDFLYVFYRELALTSFGSFRFYADDPKPFLCDLAAPVCVAERARLLASGAKLIKVCPSRHSVKTAAS